MGYVTGRSCIVSVTAQRIGPAVVEAMEAMLDEDADVCFARLNGQKAGEVAAANHRRASDSGGKVMSAMVDVSDSAQVRAMIAQAVESFGKIDVLFNSVGANKPMRFSR
jgi:meso-butanediol dehydrogenase/(S,S)-butanediol dehydrogenase/diacetyl reductase